MVVPIFNSAPTLLCFSMWVQRSFQCTIQISTIQEKVKNAGVFNVQFTKENLRSYLPLTPMPKGHSDSIDDNLPAYLLYFIQRHAGTSRYSISVQMHGFTCPYSFFLSNVQYRCPIALLSVLFWQFLLQVSGGDIVMGKNCFKCCCPIFHLNSFLQHDIAARVLCVRFISCADSVFNTLVSRGVIC